MDSILRTMRVNVVVSCVSISWDNFQIKPWNSRYMIWGGTTTGRQQHQQQKLEQRRWARAPCPSSPGGVFWGGICVCCSILSPPPSPPSLPALASRGFPRFETLHQSPTYRPLKLHSHRHWQTQTEASPALRWPVTTEDPQFTVRFSFTTTCKPLQDTHSVETSREKSGQTLFFFPCSYNGLIAHSCQ